MNTSIFDPFRMGRYVGFDNLFDLFDQTHDLVSAKINYPPYDYIKVDDNEYLLRFAVAGFDSSELSVKREDHMLTIKGEVKSHDAGGQILHRGIAQRDFEVKFSLGENVEVTDVGLSDGLLTINIQKIVEESKVKTYPIGKIKKKPNPAERDDMDGGPPRDFGDVPLND